MKKKIVITIAVVLIVILIALGLYFLLNKENDNIKFKNEYEKLNSQKGYLDIEIPKDNNVKYASFDELMEFLNNGTGIVYFGFPECPWCRNALPVLLESAKENEIQNIYYFNAKPIRDEKELKDGKIVTNKEGTKEYYELVDKLKNNLGSYEGLGDDSIKRLYFPTAVFVMGGKIVGTHIGTVDSQEDPSKPLTKNQKQELLDIYNENINKIYGTCDTEKSC